LKPIARNKYALKGLYIQLFALSSSPGKLP
jgi:hypothetical protein